MAYPLALFSEVVSRAIVPEITALINAPPITTNTKTGAIDHCSILSVRPVNCVVIPYSTNPALCNNVGKSPKPA